MSFVETAPAGPCACASPKSSPAAGRIPPRRPAHRVRAPDRLPAALQLVRHRLRLQRRRDTARSTTSSPRSARLGARHGLRDRRRAAGAGNVAWRCWRLRCAMPATTCRWRNERRTRFAVGSIPRVAHQWTLKVWLSVSACPQPAGKTSRRCASRRLFRCSADAVTTTHGPAADRAEHRLCRTLACCCRRSPARLDPAELCRMDRRDCLPVRLPSSSSTRSWERRPALSAAVPARRRREQIHPAPAIQKLRNDQLHTPPRAVVLLSGGPDSATRLAIARDMGF